MNLLAAEWLSLRRDPLLAFTLLILLVAGILALAQGRRIIQDRYHSGQMAVAQAQAEGHRLQALALDLDQHPRPIEVYRDPRRAGPVGRFLCRPPALFPASPLAVVSLGQSDLEPAFLSVSTEPRQAFLTGRELDNPERLMVGHFEFGYALLTLYPLLILSLGYGCLTADREQGRLALVLAGPISVGRLLLVRVALRSSLVIGGALSLTLVAAHLSTSPPPLGALTRVLALVLAYGLFWSSLVVWVNSWGRNAAGNALVLCALWLTLVILVPALATLMARSLYPLPSRLVFLDTYRQAALALNLERSRVMENFLEDHPELGGGDPNDFYRRRAVLDERLEAALEPLEVRFQSQTLAQLQLTRRLAPLSPALEFKQALDAVCATDGRRYHDYTRQVQDFHGRLRAFFRPYIFSEAPFRALDQVPQFQFQEPPAKAGIAPTLVVLLVWSALFLALSARHLKRLSPADW